MTTSPPGPGPLIAVYADAGPTVGYGHLGRCLALADAAPEQVVFAVSDPEAAAWARQRGATVDGALADAAPVVVLDRRDPVAPAAVDELHHRAKVVALLDELGAARAVADLCIDPPTAAFWPSCAGRRLAGFEHTLLRRDVLDAGRQRIGGARPGGPALVAMGGSDPYGLTSPVADALVAAGTDVLVAIGPGYRGPAVSAPRLPDPAAFAGALSTASVLVTAFGHSVLEAAHLGVPSICVVTRDDHWRDATQLSDAGFVLVVDARAGFEPAALHAAVSHARSAPWWARASAAGAAAIDGGGAERVVAALVELGARVPGRSGAPRHAD